MHEKAKQIPATCYAMYDAGGFGGPYALPYRHAWFCPMYKAVLRRLRANSLENIIEVECRYGPLIAIEHIGRVRKPAIPDISLPSRLRSICWNRYRPDRLIGLLGLGTFQSMSGWFAFAGRRVP